MGKKERDFQRLPFHYAWNMLYKIRQFFSTIKLTVQTTYKNLLEMETAVKRLISVFPEFSCYSLTHFPLLLCQVRIFCKFTALFDFAVHIVKTGEISQLFCNWAVDCGLCPLLAGLEKQECNDSYQRFGKRIGKQLPVSPNFGCNATRMQGIHSYPGTWEKKLTL